MGYFDNFNIENYLGDTGPFDQQGRQTLPGMLAATQTEQQEPSFWDKFGAFMEGSGGYSPMAGLTDAADMLSNLRSGPLRPIPHPVPPGAPITSPGMFGLQQLIQAAASRGWG